MNTQDLETFRAAIQNDMQIMNYFIVGLGVVISGAAGLIWNSVKSEREDMKQAIHVMQETLIKLDKLYDRQANNIRIIARQTGVEIGE